MSVIFCDGHNWTQCSLTHKRAPTPLKHAKYSSDYFVIIFFLNSGNLKFELDQIEKVPVECEEKSGMTQEGVNFNLEDLDLGKDIMERPT